MAYEFSEWEQEPEPQQSSGHSVIPPRTITGVGVLDPSVPPKKPPSVLLRILAALVLVGVVVLIVSMFLVRH
jgi:hypothetical protein